MNNQKKLEISNVNPFGTEKVGKLLMKFAIPCILSLVVSALYNIVDQIFIGQGVGYLGNAATNVVYPITVIALGFSYLIGDGCAAKISLFLGADDTKDIKTSVENSVLILLIVSIIISISGFIFADDLLYFFGATDACFFYAKNYLQIILIGIPFYMITSGVNAIIRADGSPQYAMTVMLIGALTNLILDPVTIFVLKWGVTGAAISTIIGQIISCILTLHYFKKSKLFKLDIKSLKINLTLIKRICAMGTSSFITQISIVVVCAVTNNVMIKYGAMSEYGADIPLSVIGIVMKVFSIVIAIVLGIAIGGQPIVGYNYGAKNYDRVIKTYKMIIVSCSIVGVIATLSFELIPQILIKIFGSEGEEYTKFAVLCFRIYLGGILLCCVQKASCIFLQSIGSPVKATLLSLSRDIFFQIPAVIILPIHFGILGALWSAPISDVISIIFTIVFIFIEFKKIKDVKLK